MRSTRSSALRWPSWRRNTLTICSRLLDRFPPSGFSRLRSGRLFMPAHPAEGMSDVERATASAGRGRVRILDREAATRHRVDEVDLGALEIADAHGIDEELHAVGLEHLIANAAVLFDHQPVLESGTAAPLHEHAESAAGLVLFTQQLVDFRGCRGRNIHHFFVSPGGKIPLKL